QQTGDEQGGDRTPGGRAVLAGVAGVHCRRLPAWRAWSPTATVTSSSPAGSSSRAGSRPWPAPSALPPRPVSILLGSRILPLLRLAVTPAEVEPPETEPPEEPPVLRARTQKLAWPMLKKSEPELQDTANLPRPTVSLLVTVYWPTTCRSRERASLRLVRRPFLSSNQAKPGSHSPRISARTVTTVPGPPAVGVIVTAMLPGTGATQNAS